MTSVKKTLACLNSLIQEAKLDAVEKIHLFLADRLDGVNKEALEKLLFEFRDGVQAESDLFATVKTKKPKVPRPPTAYNLFIKQRMEVLKVEKPKLKNTELMTLAASAWNEHKKSIADATGEDVADVADVPATDETAAAVESAAKKGAKKEKAAASKEVKK